MKQVKGVIKLMIFTMAFMFVLGLATTPVQAKAAKTISSTMTVGESAELTFKVKGKVINNKKVKWTVEKKYKKKVAVSKDGVVTAKKKGKVVVTGTYDGVTYKYKIKIKKATKEKDTDASEGVVFFGD